MAEHGDHSHAQRPDRPPLRHRLPFGILRRPSPFTPPAEESTTLTSRKADEESGNDAMAATKSGLIFLVVAGLFAFGLYMVFR